MSGNKSKCPICQKTGWQIYMGGGRWKCEGCGYHWTIDCKDTINLRTQLHRANERIAELEGERDVAQETIAMMHGLYYDDPEMQERYPDMADSDERIDSVMAWCYALAEAHLAAPTQEDANAE